MSHGWNLITSVRVMAPGRITIPKNERERYGIKQSDVLDVRVETPDGDWIAMDEAVFQSKYRINIPTHKMDLYGIDVGDYVDVKVRKTGKKYRG